MSSTKNGDGLLRIRREPPAFRVVTVRRVEFLTPYMARVTLAGPALEGFSVDLAAASVRLLLPASGTGSLVIPAWNGNEFLLSDGQRPTIRTFTPQRVDTDALELNLDIVIHVGGVTSEWVKTARPGDPAAVSGPGRGYAIDTKATRYLLAGDESTIPAIRQLLRAIPAETQVHTIIEIAHLDARLALPDHPRATIEWCDRSPATAPGTALIAAVTRSRLGPGTRVWAAGEAAAMHRVRRHLFEDRGLARQMVSARGYWKHGRRTDSIEEQ
jgi:NADPH-dependent ferric siderophore reductase